MSAVSDYRRTVNSPARRPEPAGLAPNRGKTPDPPLRICFMIDRLAAAGTECQLLALIRCLDRTRIKPFLCLLDGRDTVSRALTPLDCPILCLGIRSLARPSTIAPLVRLVRFLRREKIDVLQLYFPDSSYLGLLAGRLARVPYLLRTRNNLGHWMRPVDRWLGRFANGLATAIVANCEACRQAVIADERASPERVFVLENGVDLERFLDIEPPSAEASAHRCVGAVANLRPVKGLDHLVSAARLVCAKHPDVTFEVAGEGEARGLLERQIQDAGLEGRFLLRGSLSDVPRFLQSLEIAVLSSLAEGMPNAVLEYMAAARPIVVTSVGATSQLISDGVEGLLVPPGDARALAGAIEQLLQSPERARNLGLAARRRAQQQYSREAMVRRFEGFYEDLVRGPAAAKES